MEGEALHEILLPRRGEKHALGWYNWQQDV